MTNRTKRRLGFVCLALAVGFAVLNLQRSVGVPIMGVPVVFLVAGAVLLRKTRTSTDP